MKNADPDSRHLQGSGIGLRLLAVGVLALFAYMVWAAINGEFDMEVNSFAGWLQSRWHGLIDWLMRIWRDLFG